MTAPSGPSSERTTNPLFAATQPSVAAMRWMSTPMWKPTLVPISSTAASSIVSFQLWRISCVPGTGQVVFRFWRVTGVNADGPIAFVARTL